MEAKQFSNAQSKFRKGPSYPLYFTCLHLRPFQVVLPVHFTLPITSPSPKKTLATRSSSSTLSRDHASPSPSDPGPPCTTPRSLAITLRAFTLTQPRYFCKGCRRYWTKGGSLRNVPVGGGCRKNRRGKSARLSSDSITSSSSSSSSLRIDTTRVLDSGLRPDQALDDMFDTYYPSSDSGGSNIDMAVMYARYLNQVPDKLPVEIDDSFGFVGSVTAELSSSSTPSTDMNCQTVSQADEGNLGFMASNCGMEESVVFPRLESSSMLPEMNGGDVFSMNWGSVYPNMPWPAQEQNLAVASTRVQQEIGSNHHFQELVVGDWSSMEQSGFEAF
ncbi:hypothetical protein M5K25_012664 [Dendrobium thyrsiflorum]|uniref:Dof zinc finger protein n=1 Tax=Dendrobium thyrsiflorum TaxID=117978 RepID=A0ABD0V4Y3_DENTH